MKQLLKKLVPEKLFLSYHRTNAKLAAARYHHPAKTMTIIAITGTKGKTSTANYVWSVLDAAGLTAGLIGTANIRIGKKEMMNEYHMTMPGPFVLHKLLARMQKAGCTHVVMEMTSEGIKQYRHEGITPDIVLFTNLYPEHLPSHGGSFEQYKQTKGKIFKGNPRAIIANVDSEHAAFFLNNPAQQKITFSVSNPSDLQASHLETSASGTTFDVGDERYALSIPGIFNVYNALGALAVARALSLPSTAVHQGLTSLTRIAGRMEEIKEGQPYTVIVDYAHEKESMGLLLKTAKQIAGSRKIIVLLGAEGGGRDKAKRPAMGKIVGEQADYVIVSNVDPYEDDPREIIEDIARVAEASGKLRNHTLFTIEDRRAGIRKALTLAEPGDIVLITGKGSEQSMIIDGKTIPWDDRVVVREELQKRLAGQNTVRR